MRRIITPEQFHRFLSIVIVITTVTWVLSQVLLQLTPEVPFVAAPAFDSDTHACICEEYKDYCNWYQFLQEANPDFTQPPSFFC